MHQVKRIWTRPYTSWNIIHTHQGYVISVKFEVDLYCIFPVKLCNKLLVHGQYFATVISIAFTQQHILFFQNEFKKAICVDVSETPVVAAQIIWLQSWPTIFTTTVVLTSCTVCKLQCSLSYITRSICGDKHAYKQWRAFSMACITITVLTG